MAGKILNQTIYIELDHSRFEWSRRLHRRANANAGCCFDFSKLSHELRMVRSSNSCSPYDLSGLAKALNGIRKEEEKKYRTRLRFRQLGETGIQLKKLICDELSTCKDIQEQTWQAPTDNAIKFNVDAAVCKQNNIGAVAWVARDYTGSVLFWNVRQVHISNPLIIEAIALREATVAASRRDHLSVLIEGEAEEIMDAIYSVNDPSLTCANIIQDIRDLLVRNPHFSFSVVNRNCNVLAHCLVRKALSSSSFCSNYQEQVLWMYDFGKHNV